MNLLYKFNPGSQRITSRKFNAALGTLQVPKEEAKAIFAEVDTDGRGWVDIEDVAFMVAKQDVDVDRAQKKNSRVLVASRTQHQSEAGLLQGEARPESPWTLASEDLVAADVEAQQEIKEYWELIGNRMFDKGFKTVRQILLTIDKDDDNKVEQGGTSLVLRALARLARTLFDLLDINGDGWLRTKDVGRCLAPYMQKGFLKPSDEVVAWREERLSSAGDSHASASGAGLSGRRSDRGWKSVAGKSRATLTFDELLRSKGFENLSQLLQAVDSDGNGLIDSAELRMLFSVFLHRPAEDADRFKKKLRRDPRGALTHKELEEHLPAFLLDTGQHASVNTVAEGSEAAGAFTSSACPPPAAVEAS
eukprot:CAMPEP_0115598986 /NCGR_PEP_ID=MMETSP0272-20121206/14158_1 /TAXON_ID=71861 /ORGANISM="Scrippsiella trochoidea, Strain CCMP3099" /LENGTH=362 /DNA_ID=CAMNT_0003034421 /DNA_START=129 /DNA_END=1212 /DNA_ORIENTATION=+